jgi:hypothetical protein
MFGDIYYVRNSFCKNVPEERFIGLGLNFNFFLHFFPVIIRIFLVDVRLLYRQLDGNVIHVIIRALTYSLFCV